MSFDLKPICNGEMRHRGKAGDNVGVAVLESGEITKAARLAEGTGDSEPPSAFGSPFLVPGDGVGLMRVSMAAGAGARAGAGRAMGDIAGVAAPSDSQEMALPAELVRRVAAVAGWAAATTPPHKQPYHSSNITTICVAIPWPGTWAWARADSGKLGRLDLVDLSQSQSSIRMP